MLNERVLGTVLFVLAVYFSALLVWSVARYAKFRRLHPTALLTWPSRPPRNWRFLVGLDALSGAVALLNGVLQRPFHHVYSQGVMSIYFLLIVPLTSHIRLGFYEAGVWSESGFVPYERIKRLAFRETPEIVLLLLSRGARARAFRLPVPPEEYGAARRLLDDKVREHALTIDDAILGLRG